MLQISTVTSKTSEKLCRTQLSCVSGSLGGTCRAQSRQPDGALSTSGEAGMGLSWLRGRREGWSERHSCFIYKGKVALEGSRRGSDLELTLPMNSIFENPMHLMKCYLDCHPNHWYRAATGLKRLSLGGATPGTAWDTVPTGQQILRSWQAASCKVSRL